MKKYGLLATSAILVVVVAWLQHTAVPLYDGVALPDEAYRYIVAPSGRQTKLPAASATMSGKVSDGFNTDGIYLGTTEQGPQAAVSFAQHSFSVAATVSNITVTLTPQAPDSHASPTGRIVGNVYRLSAVTSDGGPVQFQSNKVSPSYIDMRLPQGYPVGATMVYRPTATAAWKPVPASRIGNDVYEAKVAGLGDYALASSTAHPRSVVWKRLLSALPLAMLLIVAAVIIIASRRAASRQSDLEA
jgi:hypothetical protein